MPNLAADNLKKALLYASDCHRATDACRTTKFIRLFTTLQPIFQSSLQPLHNSVTTPNPLSDHWTCHHRATRGSGTVSDLKA